ncbi:apolipoprotein L3-like isoform X1 [Melanotaenia boesemani]|uniref:apolipoprotein L3-like isoform X1 n=1 Tax=Melanotaenia boesemani TaxID=1250792 RepID=UPI001C04DE3C|nr:apolipoprotein L3-like isoform X1 [Melanotaenia boesemani]
MSRPPVSLSKSTVSTPATSSYDKPVKSSSTPKLPIWPPQQSTNVSTPLPVALKPRAFSASSGVVENIKKSSNFSTPPPVALKPRAVSTSFDDVESIKPPVFLSKSTVSTQATSSDDKPVKSSSTPKLPIWPPQQSTNVSTPLPVAPKPRAFSASSGVVENRKVTEPPVKADFKNQIQQILLRQLSSPLPTPKEELDDENETLDVKSMSELFNDRPSWNYLSKDLEYLGSSETEIIKVKAKHLYEVMQIYIYRMNENGENLKQLIDELFCTADSLDKVSKGTKIAGITGGATTVAGGVAAAAGVILSPFTMGASLALTAVGVGVATAGGVTGASAAIANKVKTAHDQKKINTILDDFSSLYENIMTCLSFFNEGMEQLKLHGLSVLKKSQMGSKKVAKVVELAMGEASGLTSETSTKVSGMISGFALGMDIYFTKGKNGHKVKKGLESKLAQKIRTLSEDLDKGLKELVKIKELFSRP